MDNGLTHVRVTNQIFPGAICIPMSREMTITQWHVPIDDENCYWYSLFTSFDKPVDKKLMREQRLNEHRLPDYAPLKNKRKRLPVQSGRAGHRDLDGHGARHQRA